MFNKQIDMNADKLDIMIGKLLYEVDDIQDEDEYEKVLQKIEKLVSLRTSIGESKTKESNKGAMISAGIQIASILVVLQYEKANVITSKAYSIASGMFKGS